MNVSTEAAEGTNYFLTLAVSAIFGTNCNLLLTSICDNVVIARPLTVNCQGEVGSCDQLSNPDMILCRRGSKMSFISFSFMFIYTLQVSGQVLLMMIQLMIITWKI